MEIDFLWYEDTNGSGTGSSYEKSSYIASKNKNKKIKQNIQKINKLDKELNKLLKEIGEDDSDIQNNFNIINL